MTPGHQGKAAALLWVCSGAPCHLPTYKAVPCQLTFSDGRASPVKTLTSWAGDLECPSALEVSGQPVTTSWRSARAAKGWARPSKGASCLLGVETQCLDNLMSSCTGRRDGAFLGIEKSCSRKIETVRGRGPNLGTTCPYLGQGDTKVKFFLFYSFM